MTTASDIFDHHLSVFAEGDIDGIVSDYSEDSVMVHGDQIWTGLAGARAFFHMWLDDLLPPGCRFDVTSRITTDDLVYITWEAESERYVFDFGTNTFVMREGKVYRQTVATVSRRK